VSNMPIPVPSEVMAEDLPEIPDGWRIEDAAHSLARRIRWKLFGEAMSRERFAAIGEVVAEILWRLEDEMRASGGRLIVLLFPTSHYDVSPDSVRIQRFVADVCSRHAIELLDLEPRLRDWDGTHPERPAYSPENHHWTPEGHRIAAAAILELLETGTGRTPLQRHPGAKVRESASTASSR